MHGPVAYFIYFMLQLLLFMKGEIRVDKIELGLTIKLLRPCKDCIKIIKKKRSVGPEISGLILLCQK